MGATKGGRRSRHRPSLPDPAARPGSVRPLMEVRLHSDRIQDGISEFLTDPRAGVRLLSCRPMTGRSGARLVRWLELETSSAGARDRLRQLVKHAGRTDLSLATPSTDRALIRLSSPMPEICAAVFEVGAMCVSCPLLEPDAHDSGVAARILVPRNGEARRLRRELIRRLHGHLTIERAGSPRSSAGLTPRQEQAFQAALDLGYFSYPRRADLATVAKRLGIGRSTALELLRHAVENLGRRQYRGRDREPDSSGS